jgi:hypothetical protein
MSAQSIFDHAPLGAIVKFSDGTPRPPARFKKKLAAWENRNGSGRLVRKRPRQLIGNTTAAAEFTLHMGDHGNREVIVLRTYRTFSIGSGLIFVVTEKPVTGAVRVLDRTGETGELVYLASDRADAETWLKSHGYPDAVLDEVVDDDPAAASSEGRAA